MVIQIDWLQMNCLGVLTTEALEKLELQKYSTQVFKKVYCYKAGNEILITIACEPSSSILNPLTHIVKVCNKWLYSDLLLWRVNILLPFFGLKFHSFSRLDICADFNNFRFGLLPSTLIANFLSEKYYAIGNKQFKVQGKAKNTINLQYLRFGNNNSEVSAYLYNKSQELAEVKDKPWIRDNWNLNKIDSSKDVWRLEFSIKGSRLRMLNGNSGEVDSITLNCIDDAEFMTNLYFALLKRYFAFRVNDGLSNITRMKHVELFDTSDCNYSIKMFHDSHESDRSTKIFIKKIESYNCEVRKLKAYKNMTDEKMFWLGDQYLQSVLDYYNKQDFYEKKVKDKVD